MVDRIINYYGVNTNSKKWTVKVPMIDLETGNSKLQYKRDSKINNFQINGVIRL